MRIDHEAQTPYYTLAEGQLRTSNVTSEQLRTGGGGGGFVLLTSTQLLETLAHFSRERIPERIVHAKASGARGYFEVTDDISDLTDAEFLNTIGNKTEVLVRVATTGPERGSADTVRDFRGFAVKLKTKEGNQDFVMNNQVSTPRQSQTAGRWSDLHQASFLRSRSCQIPFLESQSQEEPCDKLFRFGHVLGLSYQQPREHPCIDVLVW
jgi:Catalase